MLPVTLAFSSLLPDGLRRGTTVVVGGSTSLALALVAGPAAAGSWVAAVGISSLGLAAAHELGVDLAHLVLVAEPPKQQWATVVATLVDGLDIVVVRSSARVAGADARRLTARARERGSVLVILAAQKGLDAWPEAPDVSLTVTASAWEGLGEGHGHLRARRVTVEADGRRVYARPRRAELWLPAAGGGVAFATTQGEPCIVRDLVASAARPPRVGKAS
ncbi:MAG: hypothetical protein ACR2LQ_07060 [Acidimicrobiales bacterium]